MAKSDARKPPDATVRRLRRAQRSGEGRTVLGVVGPQAHSVQRPRPRLGAVGLEIEGPVPLPGEYRHGTTGFRYWAMAEALERVAVLWRAVLEGAWPWGPGQRLHVVLAPGTGREAVVERGRILVGGAAPPGAAMRALGHAVLDRLRPALWDVAAAGVAGFHAGFADAAAVLAALEVPGGAEGLALARDQAGTGFGRAFADVLEGLAQGGPGLRPMGARVAAERGARLLAEAVRRAAVAPDFIAEVATEMVLAATVQEGPWLSLKLRTLFARHGLLPRNPVLEGYDPHEADDGTEVVHGDHPLPWVATDAAAALGWDRPLLLCPASQPPWLADDRHAFAPVAVARECTRALAAQGMIEQPRIGHRQRRAPCGHRLPTHRLVDDGRVLRLVRERFVVG